MPRSRKQETFVEGSSHVSRCSRNDKAVNGIGLFVFLEFKCSFRVVDSTSDYMLVSDEMKQQVLRSVLLPRIPSLDYHRLRTLASEHNIPRGTKDSLKAALHSHVCDWDCKIRGADFAVVGENFCLSLFFQWSENY
jgi:hypothetical protein